MHSKAAQELYSREGHKFLIGIVTVIFVSKGHSLVIYVFDTRITDSYPMSVLPQVIYHLTGVAQRWFGVYNPWFGVTLIDNGHKLRQTVFLFQVAFQYFEQFATKSYTELPHRIKVFTFIADRFDFTAWRNAHSRNNTMDVRMKAQVLPPLARFCEPCQYRKDKKLSF